MLSVSTATVAQAIRPNIANASPSPPTLGRKERRSWNCEYTFPKRRCRPSSAARKKIIANGQEDATIEIDVHCKTVNFQRGELDENSLEYFGEHNDELASRKTSENLEICDADEKKTVRPIPFLKSAQMQRVKVTRPREEDIIDDISAKPEKSLKICNSSISEKNNNNNNNNDDDDDEEEEKEEEGDSKDCQVVVIEREDKKNKDSESIIDTDRGTLKRTEKRIIEKLSCSEETKGAVSHVLGSRMSHAVELLMRGSSENIEDNVKDGTPGIPGEEMVRDAIDNFPPIIEDNGWDSEAEVSMLRNLGDDSITTSSTNRHENHGGFLEEETSIVQDLPYYMIGFPNPPGENRCWLNATLHAMFALPFFDQPEQLESEQLRRCSQLTKTLMALRLFWSRGADHKHKTYQTVKLFKESLGILDESYPSQRQQDVSEFLTMFLNYLKTDFEKISSPVAAPTRNFINTEEAENITGNVQEMRMTPRSPRTPTKRTPLADISPSKRKLFENGDCLGQLSPKTRKIGLTYSAQDLLSPRVNRILSKPSDPSYKVHTPPHRPDSAHDRIKDNADFPKNPIDRYFLLHMMEHYRCKGCSKHRQRKVDNLMLYVDLPPGSENRTVSLDDAIKTSLEPEERILTCGKCKYDKHKVFTTFRVCPKILMVQVNRYGMCEDGSVAKFNTPVEIPDILQLELGSPDEENGCSVKEHFEPVSVIAHVGSAMDCGHYTSYVRHGEDTWYHYNDLMVTPMSRYEALAAAQTTAYLVFFSSSKV